MKSGWILLVGVVMLTLTGCGSKAETPAASIATDNGAAPQTGAPTSNVQSPDAVVTAFLESLRLGNDALAASLLTQVAREETQKKGLKVQPPGTPDMTYQIGQTEYVTPEKDGAHVGSIWSEKLETGEVASFEVIWVLRLEPKGWRIAGMATPVGEQSEPLFLDFENPDDLLQKWQASETELAEEPMGQPMNPAGQFVPPEQQFPAQNPTIQNAENPGVNPLR